MSNKNTFGKSSSTKTNITSKNYIYHKFVNENKNQKKNVVKIKKTKKVIQQVMRHHYVLFLTTIDRDSYHVKL